MVRARVQAGLDDPRQLTLELEINPGKANRAKLNRSPLRQAREIIGLLRTVVFSPVDIAIVKGDPSERRRFIDDLIVARWPRLAGVRADYERVLRQRNTLLKSLSGRLRGGPPPADAEATLDVWDTHLARAGGELLEARLTTLADLAPHVSKAYADIAPTNNDAAAEYKCSVDLTALRQAQGASGEAEASSRLTAHRNEQCWPTSWSRRWLSGGLRRSSAGSRWWAHTATTSHFRWGCCRPRAMPVMVNHGRSPLLFAWAAFICCGLMG